MSPMSVWQERAAVHSCILPMESLEPRESLTCSRGKAKLLALDLKGHGVRADLGGNRVFHCQLSRAHPCPLQSRQGSSAGQRGSYTCCQGEAKPLGAEFKSGDLISFVLDFNSQNGSLEVFRNLQSLGTAFTGLRGRALRPAVSLQHAGQRVAVLPDMADQPGLQRDVATKVRSHAPAVH